MVLPSVGQLAAGARDADWPAREKNRGFYNEPTLILKNEFIW